MLQEYKGNEDILFYWVDPVVPDTSLVVEKDYQVQYTYKNAVKIKQGRDVSAVLRALRAWQTWDHPVKKLCWACPARESLRLFYSQLGIVMPDYEELDKAQIRTIRKWAKQMKAEIEDTWDCQVMVHTDEYTVFFKFDSLLWEWTEYTVNTKEMAELVEAAANLAVE